MGIAAIASATLGAQLVNPLRGRGPRLPGGVPRSASPALLLLTARPPARTPGYGHRPCSPGSSCSASACRWSASATRSAARRRGSSRPTIGAASGIVTTGVSRIGGAPSDLANRLDRRPPRGRHRRAVRRRLPRTVALSEWLPARAARRRRAGAAEPHRRRSSPAPRVKPDPAIVAGGVGGASLRCMAIVEAGTGDHIAVENPATGEIVREVPVHPGERGPPAGWVAPVPRAVQSPPGTRWATRGRRGQRAAGPAPRQLAARTTTADEVVATIVSETGKDRGGRAAGRGFAYGGQTGVSGFWARARRRLKYPSADEKVRHRQPVSCSGRSPASYLPCR